MTTNQSEALEATVYKLKTDLETLIDNLAKNNGRLFDFLPLLVEGNNKAEIRQALQKCKDGTCNDRPPGCKNHDHDHNHGNEHGHD